MYVQECLAASGVWLCDSTNCSPPGSSVHRNFQTRILWVAISSSRGSSWPRDGTHISRSFCTGRQILYHWATWDRRIIIHLWYIYDTYMTYDISTEDGSKWKHATTRFLRFIWSNSITLKYIEIYVVIPKDGTFLKMQKHSLKANREIKIDY